MRVLLSAFFGLVLSLSAYAQDTGLTDQTATPTENLKYADLMIWGGPIYTANDSNAQAEAVAIKDGLFLFVGNRSDARLYAGPDTEIIELNGTAAFPGFTDGHAHLTGIGARELNLNLEGAASLAALKASILAWRKEHPESSVIIGRGWIETHWPEKRFPSRWDIDTVIADIPVILRRADGHALVANSKALELSSIDGQTAAPFGGEILKNALGEATGVLVDAAQSLVLKLIPEATDNDISAQLVKGSDVYAAYGWTGIHNMSVPWRTVELSEELSDSGDLKIRVYNSIVPEAADNLFEGGIRESGNRKIMTRAIKLYMDGALGSRGAALLEPYADAATSGLLLSSKAETLLLLERALQDGFQVNMHAIGDRANRLLLDWFEEAMNTIPPLDRAIENPRWRDEHAQIINMADIVRFANLGIIPSMQPSHAIGDMHFAPARLGDERLNGAYAWSTLVESGSIVVGGSDAPVERGDPLIEFYAATARRDLSGFQGANWHPDEALTRSEALKMFTLWPAIASFQEDQIGSIEIGKQADITIFDIDLMTVDEADIPKGKALYTIVQGEIIYKYEEAAVEAEEPYAEDNPEPDAEASNPQPQ